MFTKFCNCLHEFQKLKQYCLHETKVLIFFSLSQISKIANIFFKKIEKFTLCKHSKLFGGVL